MSWHPNKREIDRPITAPYIRVSHPPQPINHIDLSLFMSANANLNQTLQAIEQKLEALLQEHQQILLENQTLKQAEQRWQRERDSLVEKNDLARTRIEAMINRLKSLESDA